MTDEEFIRAYEKHFTAKEKEEQHRIAIKQYTDGETQEFSDELIDEIFGK